MGAKGIDLGQRVNRHITAKGLTLSVPQDVTNVIKTKSRLRVLVGIVPIELDFCFFHI